MPDEELAPKVWQQAKLLNRYYEKVGMAAAGQGACPRFAEFRAGYGLVDDSDSANPILQPIPPDMEEIPLEFYRGEVEASYSDGVALCKCEIPQGAVGTPVRHNLVGVTDQDGELVAVCQTLPDWVTPTEIYRAFPAITFPIERPEEPEPTEPETEPEADANADAGANPDVTEASDAAI